MRSVGFGLIFILGVSACDQDRRVGEEHPPGSLADAGLVDAGLVDAGTKPIADTGRAGGGPEPAWPPLGAFEPFDALTSGTNYDERTGSLVIAGTTLPEVAGCGLVANEGANTGLAGGLVFAKFDIDGPSRCPVGAYAIGGDPTTCQDAVEGRYLRANCALYKRWDASGALTAQLLATGGFARVTEASLDAYNNRCSVQLQLLFPGGESFVDSFEYEYDWRTGDLPFCVQAAR